VQLWTFASYLQQCSMGPRAVVLIWPEMALLSPQIHFW
jgi:hypothetical protein